jgi:hypothetical protein
MKLLELEPQFISATERGWQDVSVLSEAQGIYFLCPHCFKKNGSIGTHIILVWFANRNVPIDKTPSYRWQAAGSSYNDLTISPSIDLGIDEWHGFITNGEIT